MHRQLVKVMKSLPFITASIISVLTLKCRSYGDGNTLLNFFVQCSASVLKTKELPVCPEQINVRNGGESLNFLGDVMFPYYAMQPLRVIARSELDVPTFATRRLHACHHARAPSGGRWKCGREMSGNFA